MVNLYLRSPRHPKPIHYAVGTLGDTKETTVVYCESDHSIISHHNHFHRWLFHAIINQYERIEKVNLGITTLLALSLLLLMVSDQMPRTSDFVPYIGMLSAFHTVSICLHH